MEACGQTVDLQNLQQYKMYCDLIREEFDELCDSTTVVDDLDALIDIMVVTIGALHSLGVDAEGAWQEVMRSNMAKVDPATGKVRKREDGKILKPPGWQPPVLDPYIRVSTGRNSIKINEDGTKTIQVNQPNASTFYQWGVNLPPPDNEEFLRLHNDHEKFVADAERAGDVVIVGKGTANVTITWKDEETHRRWISTVSDQDHRAYLDFWVRYDKEFNK